MQNLPISKRLDLVTGQIIRLGLWVVMIFCLWASMRNVAWIFNLMTYQFGNLPAAFGWISAIGFDVAILLLTFYARRFDKHSFHRRFTRIVLYSNGLLSIIANVLSGVEHLETLNRITGLVWQSIPVIFGIALPVQVICLAEILSNDEEQRTKQAEREAKREAKQASKTQAAPGHATGHETDKSGHGVDTGGQKSDSELDAELLALVQSGTTSQRKLAEATGQSKGRIQKRLDALVLSGQLEKLDSGQVSAPVSTELNSESSLEEDREV